MEGLSATITSIGTLILALGTFVTAVGVAWRQYRNHLRAERAEEERLAAVKEAKEKAASAELAAGIAAAAAEKAERAIVKVGNDIFVLGEAVDGRLTQLVKEIRESEFAKGRLAAEGEAQEARDIALERRTIKKAPEGGT